MATTLQLAPAAVAHALSKDRRHPQAAPSGPLRVMHYLGSLGPGGAERQLSYLGRCSQASGHTTVVYAGGLSGPMAHYRCALEEAGVRCVEVPSHRWGALGRKSLAEASFPPRLKAIFQLHLARDLIATMMRAIERERPDVLHCWLDQTNLIGALAGLLAGVRRIVISTRNLSPRHFPRLLAPWFRETYTALAESPRVRIIANSRAGADDYADWTGIPRAKFHVVRNGFDTKARPVPGADERARGRRDLGLDPDAFLVIGVFRLDAEKRPLDFLRVLELARAEVPGLRALHLGIGGQAEQVHAAADAQGLSSILEFRGRVSDPWPLQTLADVCLLTSVAEGCPNVALESQAAGVPVVLTRGGGSPDAVDEGQTAHMCDVGDVEGMAARIVALAKNPERRAAMGAAGRQLMEQRFSLEEMVAATFALYR